MTRILRRNEIEAALAGIDLMPAIAAGFAAYSAGHCNIPPVGELLLPKGEVHIKYGCITGDATYLVKVASGFYGNPQLGLASGNGLLLVFSQETGALEAVLLDEGHLTDVRTAVAGAVAASYFAPSDPGCIGIIGTGVQARLQLQYLKSVTTCRNVMVYGRTPARLTACARDMASMGFQVSTTEHPADVARNCRLIVTTTAATTPLLRAEDVAAGTHINAMGSDTPHKQELDTRLLGRASRVIVDAFAQARLRGEAFKALVAGSIGEGKLEEIGEVVVGNRPGRSGDDDITVFDSTGLAVQDIQIAATVMAVANLAKRD